MRRRDKVVAIAFLALAVLRVSLVPGHGRTGNRESGVGHREGRIVTSDSPLPTPYSRSFVRGCPACCCDVKVPKLETRNSKLEQAARAMRYCMGSDDAMCKKMCLQWMKERKLKFRGR